MRSRLAFAFALSAMFLACSASDGSNADDGQASDPSEQDLSETGKQLAGDWKNDDGSLDALALNSDGTFIHDQFRVLNGVLVNNSDAPPFNRDSGWFTANKKKGTLTLHVTDGWHAGSTEVYAFTYTPAKILNGVFLPGHEPEAHLDLTAQPAPGSHVAYPTNHYTFTSSFCAAVGAECVALTPSSCKGGEVKDARFYSCGGGLGVECCAK
ncbi:MAG TPA: hypothetical protein VIF62_27045 [Labilithrix sp.]|jgi:hypothetical protein